MLFVGLAVLVFYFFVFFKTSSTIDLLLTVCIASRNGYMVKPLTTLKL